MYAPEAIAVDVIKSALSFLIDETRKILEARREIQKSQVPFEQLQKLTSEELTKKILDLRTNSLELFQGLDLYQSELDEVLSYLQTHSGEEPYDLRKISIVYTVQTQIETIAELRSELENGYIDLLRHDYLISEDFNDRYTQSRRILKENPKLLFEQDTDVGESARKTVDQTLIELRNILARERDRWVKKDSFRKRITELLDDIEQSYKEIAQNGWELDDTLRERYQKARDILTLDVSTLNSEDGGASLAEARQVLTDLQIVAYREQQKNLRTKKAKEEEAERQKLNKQIQDKQIRNRIIFISVFIIIPIILFLAGLGTLVWQFGTAPENVNVEIPFLGIPYSVLLWSALGSIGSMVHTVHISHERRFQTSWKMLGWAVARPLIGIIMGLVIYLAAYGGLIITVGEFTPTNYALLWTFAFIGGFSDRVQNALIDLVIGRIRLPSEDVSVENQSAVIQE